ncbi:uncharacterized protein PFL1_04735 [Pseudozyma flocculosa PF-1]|uniref:Related to NPP1 domain protein n=2 Tax=Pseudozyma flocculosa TaxID=84751 RepID=A0A5C3F5M9_9BASI|nr:uncharacterized protein PFL1_04735 [Pseudozyma flocculosa PF-1]EPQ27597.1 hypothetical protein PFL1_04735 [Pseudozyma flocculosa PF-1]SPO39276.1 related to NPP1 domain protein [Pseudozyma flocculosa]
MQFKLSLATLALAAASLVSAANEINHDQVQSFPQINPTSASDRVAIRFNPSLHVGNGCYPYAAVQANGDWSGGLAPTGAPSAACKDQTKPGQVYVRSKWYRGKWAIVYSWYFPKDVVSSGIGHRHDWEGAIVWIDNPAAANPKILGASASAHGHWRNYVPVPGADRDGDTVKIQYSAEGINSHANDLTDKGGRRYPVITWEALPDIAKRGLDGHSWGDANPLIIDANFDNNLAKAYPFSS